MKHVSHNRLLRPQLGNFSLGGMKAVHCLMVNSPQDSPIGRHSRCRTTTAVSISVSISVSVAISVSVSVSSLSYFKSSANTYQVIRYHLSSYPRNSNKPNNNYWSTCIDTFHSTVYSMGTDQDFHLIISTVC